MDFASALANLEQSANNAQNNRRRPRDDSGGNNNNNNDNDDNNQRRYQPRPRNNDYNGGGRGGGRGYNNNNYNNNHHHHHNSHHNHNRNHNNNNGGLDDLARFGYRLPRAPYNRPTPIAATNHRAFHICLLAITIDDLPYEAIWRAWATSMMSTNSNNSQNQFKVSLVCHAKHPDQVKSPWLQQRMILQPRRIVRGNSLSDPEYLSHRPGWGSVEITRAMIDLLVAGMQIGRQGDASKQPTDARFSPQRFWMSSHSSDDTTTAAGKTAEELQKEDVPPVDKFIFISETCLPVTTLNECGNSLFPATMRGTTAKSASTTTTVTTEAADAKPTIVEGGETTSVEPTSKKTEEVVTEIKDEDKSSDVKTTTISTPATECDKVIYLDTSWVNARNFNTPNTPSNKYERDQFSQIHPAIPKSHRWKADQWMVLSRTHAAALLDLDHSTNKLTSKDHMWNNFRRINASDEMYFPTTLALAGVLLDTNRIQWEKPPPLAGTVVATAPDEQKAVEAKVEPPVANKNENLTPWLERRKVTYTDWSMGARNPACFTKGKKDFANVARLARQENCLLARKFSPLDPATEQRTGDISVEEWTQAMEVIIAWGQQSSA